MDYGLQLELTTKCNAKCSFCPREEVIKSGQRYIADIDFDVFKNNVEKISKQNIELRWVSFSGLGEPLMYPQIIDAIKLIKEKFPDTILKLNTNGTLLRDKLAEELIESGIDRIIFSMNVASKEDFEQYKRLSYDIVIRNVTEFLKKKKNRKPALWIRVNAFDVNLKHMKDVRKFWKKYLNKNDRFSLGRFSNWAGKTDRKQFVEHELSVERYVCKYLNGKNVLATNMEGDAFPCCEAIAETGDSFLCIGNIKTQDIDEIYNSKRMNELRELHANGKYPEPCNKCDSWGEQVENIEEFKR